MSFRKEIKKMGDWSVLDYLIALLAGWVGLNLGLGLLVLVLVALFYKHFITDKNKDIKD